MEISEFMENIPSEMARKIFVVKWACSQLHLIIIASRIFELRHFTESIKTGTIPIWAWDLIFKVN
ncbi:hypothetical protein A0256_15360 [Mucilaginibacter sp. PAMC 26640]|nr:hypothetical protein A0256_15360 [Mucilaginibacter sp. PAMC 26640]